MGVNYEADFRAFYAVHIVFLANLHWQGEERPANLIVFAVSDLWIFLLDCASSAVYAWLFGDEEICSRCVASNFEKFFIALASIGISRLNDETIPPTEQILNFVQADDVALPFWQERVKNFLNLSYKQANFLLNLASSWAKFSLKHSRKYQKLQVNKKLPNLLQ